MQAITNTNPSPLPPSAVAAIAANRAIDAALALDVSKLDVAEINAEATEAAAASPDARLDRAYAKLKTQLSRLANLPEHRKAAHISDCIGAVEAVVDSLTRHADEADADDRREDRRLKLKAEYDEDRRAELAETDVWRSDEDAYQAWRAS